MATQTLLDELAGPFEEPALPVGEPGENQENYPTEAAPVVSEDDLIAGLCEIITILEEADQTVYDEKLAYYKYLNLMWRGIQNAFWDDVARDWRTPDQLDASRRSDEDDQYTAIIDIYKAHGESIIAALTAAIPTLRWFPDDADNPDDISTAKAYSRISEMIQGQNKASLLFIKTLFILYNQGWAAGYNVHHASKEYGTYRKPKYGKKLVKRAETTCEECGEDLSDVDPSMEMVQCPTCGWVGQPITEEFEEEVPTIEGYEEGPKTREVLEVYGPVNVRIKMGVAKFSDTPFLELYEDLHFAMLRDIYPDIADQIRPGDDEPKFNRWARRDLTWAGVENKDECTLRRIWLRPWAFNILEGKDEVRDALKQMYPKGCIVVKVNDVFAESYEEDLEEHWTVTVQPLSDKLEADPIGAAEVPVQEMYNETIGLTIETVRFSVPETFADPDVLNFKDYSESSVEVGAVRPAKPKSGQKVSDAFHSVQNASLSREVEAFTNKLEQAGQMVLGDFPSVYGGTMEGGSNTAREYELSRNQALQRLSLIWKVLNVWWAGLMKKAVLSFRRNMTDDTRYTKKHGSGFINVWVRSAEMNGTVGEVEAETSEQFPVSWAQKRGLLVELLQLKNPAIEAAVFHPENTGEIARVLGWSNLFVPGEDDRNKQLLEISELLEAEPFIDDFGMHSSHPPEEIDDHAIHAQTGRAWLNSEVGLEAKTTNPMGYQNVLMHTMEHMMYMQTGVPPPPGSRSESEQGGGAPMGEMGAGPGMEEGAEPPLEEEPPPIQGEI